MKTNRRRPEAKAVLQLAGEIPVLELPQFQ